MKHLKFVVLVFAIITLAVNSNVLAGDKLTKQEFLPGKVIFKLAPEYKVELPLAGSAVLGLNHLDQFFSETNLYHVEQMFPDYPLPKFGDTDLTLIYTAYFPDSYDIPGLCADLQELTGVVYAEPWYLNYIDLDHNDPLRNQQYGLDLCEANEAHDISTGNIETLVAIVDSGIDMNHADLTPNRWINLGEDINDDGAITNDDENNRDDDGNGKADDFYGWDFIDGDGNPHDADQSQFRGHGTHVAGIVSAKTNNNRGVASVGYNCGLMPVRTGEGRTVTFGYQGIAYAVRAGAKVINCSWGGYQGSEFARDIINNARDNDVIVVTATGNDNVDNLHYPSAYDWCVAVSATTSADRKANFSNYGEWVDICAPGAGVMSTTLGGGYAAWDGTSMASPFCAGVVALIRATYPRLDAQSVKDLLFEGADNIDDQNRGYIGELGVGRINILRSLELGQIPIPIIGDLQILNDGNNNGRFDPDESLEIAVTIGNGEDGVQAEDVNVTITCEDSTVTITQNHVVFDVIDPGEDMMNGEDPFVITISEDARPHTTWLTVTVTANPHEVEVSREYEIVIGRPDILIIDDDGGDAGEEWYFRTVESLEQGWARWDALVRENEDPLHLVDMMAEYPVIIWSTGNSNPPLNEIEQWILETALYEGGNVLFVGNRIGDDESNEALLHDYFGAAHQSDSVRAVTVNGLMHSPVNSTMTIGLGISPELRLSTSSCRPVNGADSLAIYRVGNSITGLAGVFYENDQIGNRTVYMGFALENIQNRPTDPGEVIGEIFNYLKGEWEDPDGISIEVFTPMLYTLEPAYPNPFNGMVRFNYSLSHTTGYRLAVYSSDGRELALLGSGQAMQGYYGAVWNAVNFPSGIYVITLRADGQNILQQKVTLIK